MLSAGLRLFAVLLFLQTAHAQEQAREEAPAAAPPDNAITISGIRPVERDGFIRFNAQAGYTLPAEVIAAMNRDTELVFITQLQVLRENRFLPDKKIIDLRLRRRIAFNALTRKYIVDDLTFAEQTAFNTLDEALEHLGRYRDIAVIEKSLAVGSGATYMRIRVRLSRPDLPLSMQAQSMLPDWWLSSDWYRWSL